MGKEWLEIAGCGMVHPQGLRASRLRSGGVERVGLWVWHRADRDDPLQHHDIRLFYENDVRFFAAVP
jgi:phenylalanyl-tRNA synthetase alpha subunit